jgi:hypothetical protein
MSSLSIILSVSIFFIYMCLNAWPEAGISRFLLSSFGPSPEVGELRSHFLLRVMMYSFSWMTMFALVGVGSQWASSRFGLDFKSEIERLVYFFFVWAAAVYTGWVSLRSLINILFLKLTGRDWAYVSGTD